MRSGKMNASRPAFAGMFATILTAFCASAPAVPEVSVRFARSNFRENPETVWCAVGYCAAARRGAANDCRPRHNAVCMTTNGKSLALSADLA